MQINDKLIKTIVESGTNYVKFTDGTAICWGQFSSTTGTAAQSGQYSSTFTQPLPFTFLSGTIQGKTISGNPARKVNVRFSQALANTNQLVGVVLSDIASYNATVDYLVIGKWK